jgi:two-component system cell cycle sensor histidine kinase/response regulator CckA
LEDLGWPPRWRMKADEDVSSNSSVNWGLQQKVRSGMGMRNAAPRKSHLRPELAGGYFRPMILPEASARNRAPTERPAGGYTVLVVDDEEAVRRLACRMLTWTGYQALEATHGREAIATIEQHAGGIHLVLTDIKMPGMNGRELGRQVEQRWPGKPVLYMSGFASEVFQGGLLEVGAPFLAKPFTQEDLASKVRGLLGG